MSKRTAHDRRRDEALRARLDADPIARMKQAKSFFERIERLEDEMKTSTVTEIAEIELDIADVRKEAKVLGFGAREIAAAPAGYAAWNAETWPARSAAIKAAARASREAAEAELAAA